MYMVTINITMLATNTRGMSQANHGSGAGGENCGGARDGVLRCCLLVPVSISKDDGGDGGSPFPMAERKRRQRKDCQRQR